MIRRKTLEKGLYGFTLMGLAAWLTWNIPQTVRFFDSGLLISAAYQAGVSHPSGQPVYTMLTKVLTLLPLGSIAFRAHLLSAFSALLVLVIAARLISRVFPSFPAWARPLLLLFIGLNPLFLFQAVRTEVYLLELLLLMVLIAQYFQFSAGSVSRQTALFLFIGGLAFALHPLITLPIFFGLALLILVRARSYLRLHHIALLTFFLFGFLPLMISLPILAKGEPVINWGSPATIEGLLFHLLGQAYVSNFTLTASSLFQNIVAYGAFLSRETGVIAVFMWAGLFWLGRSEIRLVWIILLLNILPAAAQPFFQPANPDIIGYMGLTLVLGGILSIGLLTWVTTRFSQGLNIKWVNCLLWTQLTVLILIQSVVYLTQWRPIASDNTGIQLIKSTLNQIPARAQKTIIQGGSDHIVFPLLYLFSVESQRPDIVLVIEGLLSSKWYLEQIKKADSNIQLPFLDAAVLKGQDLPTRFFGLNFPTRSIYAENYRLLPPPKNQWQSTGLLFSVQPRQEYRNHLLNTVYWMRLLDPIRPLSAYHLTSQMALRYILNLSALFLLEIGEVKTAFEVIKRALTEKHPWPADVLPARPLFYFSEKIPRESPIFFSTPWESELIFSDILAALDFPQGVRLIESLPEFPEKYLLIISHLAARRMDERHITPFESRLFSLMPGSSKAVIYYLGVLFFNSRYFEKAMAYLQLSLRQNPSHYRTLFFLGKTCAVLAQYARAEKYFKRALQSNPAFDEPRIELIKVYLAQKFASKASHMVDQLKDPTQAAKYRKQIPQP